MKKKITISSIIIISIIIISLLVFNNKESNQELKTLEVMIVSKNNNTITLIDKNDIIYSSTINHINEELGSNLLIKYTGIIDSNNNIQNIEIINYSTTSSWNYEEELDKGIFSRYYTMANRKLEELTLDEKIGQLIIARYFEEGAVSDINNYHLGGFVFFEKDFKDKTKTEVTQMINNLQDNSKIPLLISVDEEGGKIVRVSSNPNLISERFKSSQQLYDIGGMTTIERDTINKSKFLYDLGINLNLAPVVDVTTNESDYMYERALGKNTDITSLYAKTVINASKGTGVSYTLKHFPGYGNNLDTHTSTSVDNRSYESILSNDIPPFKAGIDVGAEAVLVSHNIISSIDPQNPASLSSNIHNLLRDDLGFTGVIITDDLSMGATSNIDNAAVKAILAGNNLIITTDYGESFDSIKNAIENDELSEEMIDKLALRVLAWKYYKGMMIEEK